MGDVIGYVEYQDGVYPYIDKDENGYRIEFESVGNVGVYKWVGERDCEEVNPMQKVWNVGDKHEEEHIKKLSGFLADNLNEFEMSIYETCLDIAGTLINKNRDYGDSYRNIKDEFGDTALIIRQTDKLNRLKALATKENLVNESTTDTKHDGAGYYILDLAYERLKADETG
jgi:hypothetical protein